MGLLRTGRSGHAAPMAAAVVVVLAVALSPLPATGHAEAETAEPSVHTVTPRPGAVTSAGAALLQGRVPAADGVATATVTLDGEPVAGVEVSAPDAAGDVLVSAAVTLTSGAYVAHLSAEDSTGAQVERTWAFTATDRSTVRLAGADRFDTAVAIARAAFPRDASADAAVLARADDFADALAGVPLGAAVAGPLLLSDRDGLSPATATELQRVLAPGSEVYLLGGTNALGERVATDLDALGLRPVRVAGTDRYATAAAVARRLPASAAALLVSGATFPDALAASAPAARDGLPILLTAPDDLPDATAAALAAGDVDTVTIVGGTAAVSEDVEQDVRRLVPRVARLAGLDRYGTAALVLDAFFGPTEAVSLASGETFPDALGGALHAGARGAPLLLTAPAVLPASTAGAVATQRPLTITAYGGAAAVGEHVLSAALRAAVGGPGVPRISGTAPAAHATVAHLDVVTVALDRPVDPLRSSVYVEVGGVELPSAVAETGATTTLTAHLPAAGPSLPVGRSYAGLVTVAATGTDGGVVHHEIPFTYELRDPVFATAGPVALHLPSRDVEMIGFHESDHDGARQQSVRGTATPTLTLPSRGRGNGSHTAADVVAAPDLPVFSPVTGVVLRAGTYILYCDHADNFVVIEPQDRPGWEVKVLHFHGLQVAAGDHVVAGTTRIGDGPRTLPFASQVDRYSHERQWPHLHIEVIDPSIPDRPGTPC